MTKPNAPAKTYWEAVRIFWTYRSPQFLGTWFLVSIAVLVAVVAAGNWSFTALFGVLAVLAFQPFLEWTLHVFVLHDKPKLVGGKTFDTVVAKDHRAHHLDPRDVGLVFIPIRWVGYLILTTVVTFGLMYLWFGIAVAAAVLATQAGLAITYEWTHYLIHSDVVAKNPFYKKIRRAHRNHHYRDSTYWLGVTNQIADAIIGTNPDPETVSVKVYAKDILQIPIPKV